MLEDFVSPSWPSSNCGRSVTCVQFNGWDYYHLKTSLDLQTREGPPARYCSVLRWLKGQPTLQLRLVSGSQTAHILRACTQQRFLFPTAVQLHHENAGFLEKPCDCTRTEIVQETVRGGYTVRTATVKNLAFEKGWAVKRRHLTCTLGDRKEVNDCIPGYQQEKSSPKSRNRTTVRLQPRSNRRLGWVWVYSETPIRVVNFPLVHLFFR